MIYKTPKATPVYLKNSIANTPIIINRGGAGSSKSHSVATLLVQRAIEGSSRGTNTLMLRKTLPAVEHSIQKLLEEEVFSAFGIENTVKKRSKNQRPSYRVGNSLIQLSSLDDPSKIQSTEWDNIWMEEATEFRYDDFQILDLRLGRTKKNTDAAQQIFLSFNPIDEYHWIKEQLIDKRSNITEIHSSYMDNPFLSDSYVQKLEDLVSQDINYYRIFALGEWGKLEGVIYSNWCTVEDIPKDCDEYFYGLDFGFNAPSCLVEIGIKDRLVYVDQKLYASKLLNNDIIRLLPGLIRKKTHPIYADNAEPDRIEEIFRAGWNIKPANKSVNDGIDFVQREKLHITKRSDSIIKEIRAYLWKKDKNDKPLDEPVKLFDHSMDATRYALFTHLCNGFIDISGLKASGKRTSLNIR